MRIIKKMIPLLVLVLPDLAQAIGEVEQGLRSVSLLFPLTGLSASRNIGGLIYNIIQLLLLVAGALAVLFVIIGGYQYLISAGNEELAEKGKKTLVNAIIGVVVVVLSYVIINVVVNTVSRTGFFGL